LKTLSDLHHNRLIKNQQRRTSPGPIGCALVAASTPTPLRLPAQPRPSRDPRGGLRAPVSLPLCVTPYGISGLDGQFGARWGVATNGVGGAAFAYPGQGGRVHLARGVRT